jgi:DNA-binding MarR family transcriptional regulator
MTEVAEQPSTWNAPGRVRALPARAFRARDQLSVADDALDVLEQHRLSPAELRILLAVREVDVELNELARSLERRPIEVRRAAARLYARGLLRWRYSPRPGTSREKEEVLGISGAGRSVLRPLTASERLRSV